MGGVCAAAASGDMRGNDNPEDEFCTETTGKAALLTGEGNEDRGDDAMSGSANCWEDKLREVAKAVLDDDDRDLGYGRGRGGTRAATGRGTSW